LLLWLGSLCEQAPFKPIAQNFLLSISSRRIEAVSVTSSFLNSRTIGFKSRGLSFHVSDLNGAKEGCQAARQGDFLRPNQRAALSVTRLVLPPQTVVSGKLVRSWLPSAG
jgi:hypothetical protein